MAACSLAAEAAILAFLVPIGIEAVVGYATPITLASAGLGMLALGLRKSTVTRRGDPEKIYQAQRAGVFMRPCLG